MFNITCCTSMYITWLAAQDVKFCGTATTLHIYIKLTDSNNYLVIPVPSE